MDVNNYTCQSSTELYSLWLFCYRVASSIKENIASVRNAVAGPDTAVLACKTSPQEADTGAP